VGVATRRVDGLWRWRAVAAGLRAAGAGLDAFTAGEDRTDVRAVFSWSYRALPAPHRGAVPAAHPPHRTRHRHRRGGEPDRHRPAAARARLDDLAAANLVIETVPGRYAFHDLIRVYAAELSERQDSAEERDAARRRLLDHYLHSTVWASRRLRSIAWSPPPAPAAGVTPEAIPDEAAAMDWLGPRALGRAAHQRRHARRSGRALRPREGLQPPINTLRTAQAAAALGLQSTLSNYWADHPRPVSTPFVAHLVAAMFDAGILDQSQGASWADHTTASPTGRSLPVGPGPVGPITQSGFDRACDLGV
jgi:hypothetical protein